MRKLIMGIDGGGTKSHLALFDTNGNFVGASACGTLNHENLEGAFEEFYIVLKEFIHSTLKDVGATIEDVVYAVCGIAGTDTKSQHHTISGFLRKIGLKKFTLCNDAFLGVAAGCPNCIGICAINGTGSTMAAIDRVGTTVQIAGVGEISNDCGGGEWYGVQVLGAVYGELFKCEPTTVLTKMLLDKMNISHKEDYVEIIADAIEDPKFYASVINRFAFEAAEAGDEIALNILRKSARHYTGGICHLAKELDFSDETLNITLAGSVFVKEKVTILPQLIEESVRARLGERPVKFVKLEAAPVIGAVLWAAQHMGMNMDAEKIWNDVGQRLKKIEKK